MVAEGIPGLVKQTADQAATNEIKGSNLKKIAIGTFAGVLPGLLGIGTGGILVPAFTFCLKTPVKTAMALMGLLEENFRLPLCPGLDATREALKKELVTLGLLR